MLWLSQVQIVHSQVQVWALPKTHATASNLVELIRIDVRPHNTRGTSLSNVGFITTRAPCVACTIGVVSLLKTYSNGNSIVLTSRMFSQLVRIHNQTRFGNKCSKLWAKYFKCCCIAIQRKIQQRLETLLIWLWQLQCMSCKIQWLLHSAACQGPLHSAETCFWMPPSFRLTDNSALWWTVCQWQLLPWQNEAMSVWLCSMSESSEETAWPNKVGSKNYWSLYHWAGPCQWHTRYWSMTRSHQVPQHMQFHLVLLALCWLPVCLILHSISPGKDKGHHLVI
jgi:hypothetical protein